MDKYKRILFIIVVILQVALLGFMIAKRMHLLRTGKKVLLQCEPVDPRSLFSGDYVILNYKISTLETDMHKPNLHLPLKEDELFKRNDTVYVALKKEEEGKFWIAKEISKDRDTLKKTYDVVIRGKITSAYDEYDIRYGVEEYFVPQFEGKEIEQNMAYTSVEISISESGESAINKLFINDKEVKFY
jgi:uncharacterized membrane-anchored protein